MDEKLRQARNEYYRNRRQNMTEEERAKEREHHRLYMREWRKKNPEKAAKNMENFWKNYADKIDKKSN